MPEASVLDLGGTWRLGWQDTRRGDRAFAESPAGDQRDWLEAVVPGEVHRDLERQGILEPIELGLGALAAQWVDRVTDLCPRRRARRRPGERTWSSSGSSWGRRFARDLEGDNDLADDFFDLYPGNAAPHSVVLSRRARRPVHRQPLSYRADRALP